MSEHLVFFSCVVLWEKASSSDLDNRFMCTGAHIKMLAVTILLLGNIDLPNK